MRKFSRLLIRSSGRYLFHHPWLFVLSVIGVGLGVSVVVSIDIANTSARTAFALSSETVTGKATHQVIGPGEKLEERVYLRLRMEAGIRNSAPVVEGYVQVPRFEARAFHLFGIDPLAEEPFRTYLGQDSGIDLAAFMTQPGAVLVSEGVAREYGLEPGDGFEVEFGGRRSRLFLAGLIEPSDDRSARAMESLLIVDIATAQEVLGMSGSLSRIDLRAPSGTGAEDWLERVRTILPQGVTVVRSSSRTETIEQMTEAFNLNLTALSLLALIVGMFLIYNAMTFSVLQRRALIGQLRAVGVTRREIGTLVLGEAAVTGVLGTLLGLLLGFVMGKGLVGLVTQTINDLYYVVTVRDVVLSSMTVTKGGLLGIITTLLAAFMPAREATRTTVSTALQRSHVESRIHDLLPALFGLGVVTGMAGFLLLLVPGRHIIVSYLALLCVILAFALITPAVVVFLMRMLRPVMGYLFGMLGSMSARSVVVSLSRSSVAIAALMIALAASVGVGIMVESFRGTVTAWLDYTLQADIYVQPPSPVARRVNTSLEPEVVARLARYPGVRGVSSVRQIEAMSPGGTVELTVIDPGPDRDRSFRYTSGNRDRIWHQFTTGGAVLLSEPFAYRRGLSAGDTVMLHTDKGLRAFPVAGVHYDYSSDQGSVLMSRNTFEAFFEDRDISGLALYLEPGTSDSMLIRQIEQDLSGRQHVVVRSNRGLRETSLTIFDRTFTITAVLRMLAVIVAFVGVLSALMALQMERVREFAVLRASGLTPQQVWRYVTMQTGLMGLAAGVLSIPLGTVLAYILIYVINRRSFGWTLQIVLSPDVFIQAVLVALIGAILAGLYPSYRMARSNPALALREEG